MFSCSLDVFQLYNLGKTFCAVMFLLCYFYRVSCIYFLGFLVSVDLAGLSTTKSFGKIVTHEPSLTSSGHTMDLLGLSKTTSPPMNNVSFLHSSLNGSLHSSLNKSSLT